MAIEKTGGATSSKLDRLVFASQPPMEVGLPSRLRRLSAERYSVCTHSRFARACPSHHLSLLHNAYHLIPPPPPHTHTHIHTQVVCDEVIEPPITVYGAPGLTDIVELVVHDGAVAQGETKAKLVPHGKQPSSASFHGVRCACTHTHTHDTHTHTRPHTHTHKHTHKHTHTHTHTQTHTHTHAHTHTHTHAHTHTRTHTRAHTRAHTHTC
jgi:hypothetical protein